MLTLGVIGGEKGSARSASYYTGAVATGRDDYYSGSGEAPGRWVGAGSTALGLNGTVDGGEFRQVVMEATDPGSGEQLRRLVGARPVNGYDLTFSAPKSVTLLHALGDGRVSDAVRNAHDQAVVAALGYMEREACAVRLGRGGRGGKEIAAGFVGAVFRHRTSRAGDPQLHTHAVVANLAKRSDGRYVALDGTALFQHAKTGGVLYQAELRARLARSLGVDWTETVNGLAEIRGVSGAVIEHFSKRRAQIVAGLGDRVTASARSAQAVALATRPAKAGVGDLEQSREDWRAQAAELGLDAETLAALTGRGVTCRTFEKGELAEVIEQLAGEGGLTRRASSFDRRAVLQAFADAAPAGVPIEGIEDLADRFLESPKAVELEAPPGVAGPGTIRRADGRLIPRPTGALYSTPNMLDAEHRLVAAAAARTGEGVGVAAEQIDDVIAARRTLGLDQIEMVRSLARSGDGVEIVRAAAGTGKTYALDAVAEAWRAAGFRVVGGALSARAACELRDSGGIKTTATIARILSDFDRGWGFSSDNVVVIDEAAMVGTRALAKLSDEAERAGAKLVLIGDDRQLPEIDAGGGFRGLANRLGASTLTENRRQRDAEDRRVLDELRAGRPEEWVASMDRREQLVIARGSDEQHHRLVSDWWSDARRTSGAMIFAPSREAARDLNRIARSYMEQDGRLGEVELAVGEKRFAAGDKVLCLRNSERDLQVRNGERGTILAVDEQARSLRVAMDTGVETELPASYIEQGNLGHGYAMTVHKAQGMTVDQSYVLGSEELYAELGYTAFSRHRDSCRFYLNAGSASDQLEFDIAYEGDDRVMRGIELVLGRQRANEMAIDVHERDVDLAGLSDQELAMRSGQLENLLATYPAEMTRLDETQTESLAEDEKRLSKSMAEREQLGRLERTRRRELDERISRQEALVKQNRERAQALADQQAAREVERAEWVEQNRLALLDAVRIEHELERRRKIALDDAVTRATYDSREELTEFLGRKPDGPLDAERWERAARALAGYRHVYGQLPEADEPTGDPERTVAWRSATEAAAPPRGRSGPTLDVADFELS